MAIEVPDEFRSFLRTEEARARDTTLEEARAVAIRAYQGDKYGDEEEGRSQAVTRDVSEVVDFMLVGILGTIMAGGKAVEFDTEPEEVPQTGPDGQPVMQPQQDPNQPPQPVMRKVDYGAEATAAVHYQFMRKQKGYRILHDAGKAGMLEKTGIVKTYVEPRAPLRHSVQVPQGVIEGDEASGFTLQSHKVISAAPVDEAHAMADPLNAITDVTIEVPQPPVVRDVNIPNEWFLVSPDTVDLDDSPYVGDIMPVSISQLVAMGYDYAELLEVWADAPADTVVDNARDADRSQNRSSTGSRTNANRILWLRQEYPLYDLNGDGIAERLFVHRIGERVLSVMEVDEQPYSGWSPMPMQHRFTGQSMADKTMDVQRIRTVLLRQGLDSLYQTTSPRMLVHEDAMSENTIDDLLTVRPGALIRWKGANAPTPLQTNDSSPVSFNAMEMMSAERESRTGVTRQSQGLNPDTTNKTASGMAMLQANGDQIELYVTRNLAEMLVAPMFGKRYRLMRAHQQPFKMKIEGTYTMVDPSKWPEDPDMQINVGLGTGSRDQRIAYRREVLEMQQAAKLGGLRIVDEGKFYNSAKAFIDDTNLGVATDFFNDPSTMGPAPEQPDPEAAKAQSDAMLTAQQQQQAHDQAMAKITIAQQESEAKLELGRQTTAAQIEASREESAQKLELERQKAAVQAQLAEQQQAAEISLAERRFAHEREMAERKAAAAPANDGITKLRPGGNLDE